MRSCVVPSGTSTSGLPCSRGCAFFASDGEAASASAGLLAEALGGGARVTTATGSQGALVQMPRSSSFSPAPVCAPQGVRLGAAEVIRASPETAYVASFGLSELSLCGL